MLETGEFFNFLNSPIFMGKIKKNTCQKEKQENWECVNIHNNVANMHYIQDLKNRNCFLLKKFFINIQTYVRNTRTFQRGYREERGVETGRYFICNSVDSLKKVL